MLDRAASRVAGMGPAPPESRERWNRAHTQELFRAYAITREIRIRNEIVGGHLNLVQFVVSRQARRGVAEEDLFQAGCVGLIRAVERYDLARGTQFITYAMPFITGEIRGLLRDHAWIVQVPRRLKQMCVSVRRASAHLAEAHGHSPRASEIARALHLAEPQVLASQALLEPPALSLDTDVPQASVLGQEDENLLRSEHRVAVRQLLALLPHRERLIVYLRYFREIPLHETARALGISTVHASRVVGRILVRLRALLANN